MIGTHGIVDMYFETGTEGVLWVFIKDGYRGLEDIHYLEGGERITIFNEDGSIAFEGCVEPDWDAGWEEYPPNPGQGQPAALGYWMHWTQQGWEPDKWAALFIRGDQPNLKATLHTAC